MSDSHTSLKTDVARRVSLWEAVVFTETEMAGWLLDRFAFALQDVPAERHAVAEILDIVPPLLITAILQRLTRSRTASGWHWPPSGLGLATPSSNVSHGVATADQSAVLDLLAEWLQERQNSR